jgi:hemerythrin superfamily protein
MPRLIDRISPLATNMIRMDHTHVLATFHQFERTTPDGKKRALVNTVCVALEIHAQLEEEIFYPALRAAGGSAEVLDKSLPEHNEMKRLIARLRSMQPGDLDYDETFMALMRDVIHHVADEETVLLPEAERLLGEDRLAAIGADMTKRRLQLAVPRAGEIAVNTARSMPASTLVLAAGTVIAAAWVLDRSFNAVRGRAHA